MCIIVQGLSLDDLFTYPLLLDDLFTYPLLTIIITKFMDIR